MIRKFSTDFAVFSIFVDILGVIGMMIFTASVRPSLNSLPFAAPINQAVNFPTYLYVVNPIVWVISFLLLNVYDGRRNLRVVDEVTSLTLGSFLAGGLLAGILYLTVRDISRLLFLTLVLSVYLVSIVWRLLVRLLAPTQQHASIHRRVLIVGRGQVGLDVKSRVITNKISNLTFVGFLDDDSAKRAKFEDILGSLDKIRQEIDQQKVTDVIVALPSRAHKRLDQVMISLIDMPIQIWIIPDYFHLALHSAEIEDFLGIPMLNMRALALDEYQLLIKRCFDLLGATLLILFSLPWLGIIALLIWLEDRGPVLFQQARVGTNGKPFTMYKFRTMKVGADKLQTQVNQFDEQGNLIHKRCDDPRITRIGRFLRRLSLDELPQFFNVLIGNMSLVGPRPEQPFLVDRYQPWQRKRFAVPQGITGWWQIHGRSDKPMHLHTEDDLYYIQNYSIWLDIQILTRTVWTILRGKGAY
jgi:exopolysaccharide biosynthesis polyprenyl glycosylphosphotransferase